MTIYKMDDNVRALIENLGGEIREVIQQVRGYEVEWPLGTKEGQPTDGVESFILPSLDALVAVPDEVRELVPSDSALTALKNAHLIAADLQEEVDRLKRGGWL